MTPFFFKKKRKRRCPEAARCRFFAAVSATVIGVSRRLQLEKEKQAARDTSEHQITCERKMFISTCGFLETPQDENRCLHNRKWRRKTLLASSTWSWNPNVPNLTDPRRCLDLATRKLALLAVGSCFKNVQPPRTSFLESPAENITAIVTKTDQKMPKDRTILSSSSQKARARTCKRKRRRKVGACAERTWKWLPRCCHGKAEALYRPYVIM